MFWQGVSNTGLNVLFHRSVSAINHRPRPRCSDTGPLNITTKCRRQSVSFFTFNEVRTTFLPPPPPLQPLPPFSSPPLSSAPPWVQGDQSPLTAALPFVPENLHGRRAECQADTQGPESSSAASQAGGAQEAAQSPGKRRADEPLRIISGGDERETRCLQRAFASKLKAMIFAVNAQKRSRQSWRLDVFSFFFQSQRGLLKQERKDLFIKCCA